MTHDQASKAFEEAFERLVAIHNPSGHVARNVRRCWVCKHRPAQGLLGLCEPCANQRLGGLLRVAQPVSG